MLQLLREMLTGTHKVLYLEMYQEQVALILITLSRIEGLLHMVEQEVSMQLTSLHM